MLKQKDKIEIKYCNLCSSFYDLNPSCIIYFLEYFNHLKLWQYQHNLQGWLTGILVKKHIIYKVPPKGLWHWNSTWQPNILPLSFVILYAYVKGLL